MLFQRLEKDAVYAVCGAVIVGKRWVTQLIMWETW